MIFNTWVFAVFAIVSLCGYWVAVPQRWKPHYIVAIGCIFYAWSVPFYLVLIAALSLITYFCSRRIMEASDPATKKKWAAVAVGLITFTLIAFKYSTFFALTVDQIARARIIPVPQIVVPLAISFFTFEFVHVIVDVYLGKIRELHVLDFAVFTMFFPTLVAGPIKRYQSFAPIVRRIESPPREIIALNIYRVMIGLAKKTIIADSMAALVGPLTDPSALPYGRLDDWVAILAYTAKIYFDFSGYSDIAIGLAGLLGIPIPENFDRPYWSENISVFWRRWHMSLSSWIRDYVFIPLGGSRGAALGTLRNLFLAMALAGLWHGAAWTFVAWGLWHGIGLAVHRAWSLRVVPSIAFLRDGGIVVRAGSIALTFAFVALGWVLFAASSFQAAATVLEGVLLP